MVSRGWIQPSMSEWCSPVLILKKPNGGSRFLVDLLGINARTKPISYYMPDMHECWQRLRNAKILSTCDLDRGYWQLNLDKESRKKTAFATPYGNFEYKVVWAWYQVPIIFNRLWKESCAIMAFYIKDWPAMRRSSIVETTLVRKWVCVYLPRWHYSVVGRPKKPARKTYCVYSKCYRRRNWA